MKASQALDVGSIPITRSIFFCSIVTVFLIFSLTGCASTGYHRPVTNLGPGPFANSISPGVTHTVRKAETLWGISKNYGVPLETILKANGLSKTAKLEVGQALIIPKSSSAGSAPISPRKSSRSARFEWPLKGRVLIPYGGKEDGVTSKGIVIEAQEQSVVLAAEEGRISFVDEKLKGYGKTIVIEHADGFSTVYARNAELQVTLGQWVRRSEPIARVGHAGRGSTPQLYFEIRKNSKPQNPIQHLP